MLTTRGNTILKNLNITHLDISSFDNFSIFLLTGSGIDDIEGRER